MPYTEASADLFFGREQDILLIANVARANPLSILYGPSGVGKSSVLQAGVLRHVRDENARRLEQYGAIETVVAYTSDWRDDPLAMLGPRRRTTRSSRPWDQHPTSVRDGWTPTLSCSSAPSRRRPAADPRPVRGVLPLPPGRRGRFADELARPPASRARGSTCSSSIREDALAQLDEFEDAIPGVFDNTLRLEHLDEESARSAIIEPLRLLQRTGRAGSASRDRAGFGRRAHRGGAGRPGSRRPRGGHGDSAEPADPHH